MPSKLLEEIGVIICTAVRHQRVIEMLWLHFWGGLILSIFTYGLRVDNHCISDYYALSNQTISHQDLQVCWALVSVQSVSATANRNESVCEQKQHLYRWPLSSKSSVPWRPLMSSMTWALRNFLSSCRVWYRVTSGPKLRLRLRSSCRYSTASDPVKLQS